jgi:hypothetical protein
MITTLLSESEHQEFARSGATFADWRDGTYHRQVRELHAEREAQSKEAAALEPYIHGAPPKGSGLAGFKPWRDEARDEVDRLESAEERLRKNILPTDTIAAVKAGIERGAQRLLAAVGIVDADKLAMVEAREDADAEAAQLEARLAAERRASAVTVEALRVVESKLAFARKALAALDAREEEFVRPHLRDYAKIYGQQYVKKAAELAEIASRAFAAREMLAEFHKDNWSPLNRIALPRPLGFAGDDTALDLRIKPEDTQWWADTKRKLLADPSANIKLGFNS